VHTVLAKHRGKALCVKRVLELRKSVFFLGEATEFAILVFFELSEPTPSVIVSIFEALRDNDRDLMLRHYILHRFATSRGEPCMVCSSIAKG
jgi:hypothetical protein